MIIAKDNKTYTVIEKESKWVVIRSEGKLSVSFDVSKALCGTKEELREYVLSNNLF